jgi:hypothetical protein
MHLKHQSINFFENSYLEEEEAMPSCSESRLGGEDEESNDVFNIKV